MAEKDWQVKSGQNMFIMSFANEQGKQEKIHIKAKAGDDIEELATYINGQTDKVSASVNETGQLQIVMAGNQTGGAVNFAGSLAQELEMSGPVFETISDLDLTTVGGSQRAVALIDGAMKFVDSHRSELGAYQNRFGHAINNLENINENLASSNSRIKDTDFAKETTKLIRQQILQQVSTTVLAQAKQAPNLALTLLAN